MLRRRLSESAEKKLDTYQGYVLFSWDGDINKPITYCNSGLGFVEIKALPLHVAIERYDVDLVNELCQCGAFAHKAMGVALNLCKYETAPSNDLIKIIDILLSKGAKRTKSVEEAFKRNKESKEIGIILSQESVKTLTTYENTFDQSDKFNEIGKCGYAPLHYAAKIGDIALINELCAKGADVHQKDKNKGYTPLEYAAENGLVLAVQALLKYQPNNDSIISASKLSHYYQKSCLWSSCFWKSYKKIAEKGIVNYTKTTDLLDSAISNLDPMEFKEFRSKQNFG